MKIYVKTNIWSIRGTMTFTDELEKPLYFSKMNIFAGGATVSTPEKADILRLKQSMWTGNFSITDMRTKKLVGKCKPKLLTLKTGTMKVDLNGQPFTVKGSFFAFQFTIVNAAGETVVTANKKLMSWGDAYEIDIHDTQAILPEYIVALCVIFNAKRKQ